MNVVKLLFMAGCGLIVLAGIVYLVQKTGIPLGRLPGDIYIKNENGSFYFPVTTCILISVLVSVAVFFLRK